MRTDSTPACDVLHVTQPTEEGVGKVVAQLVSDQCKAGLSVALASPDDTTFHRPLSQLGCNYYPWAAVRSPRKGLRTEARRILEIIQKTRPKVLHLHSSKAGLVSRLAIRGSVPTIFHPNGWSFRVGPSWMRRGSFLFEVFAGNHWTDKVLCVSRSEADALHGKVDPSKLELVPNGIDLTKWNELGSHTKQAARAKLGVAPGTPLAVAASRVTRQKGHDLMVQMWPQILRSCPDAQLIWVGGGDEQEKMALETADSPSIHFPGATDNPRLYFEAADVVVMPSRWEGHSLAMLEALATARPVVAFDVEGMKETIEPVDEQSCGSVVPFGNLDRFSSAVVDFLTMESAKRQSIGLTGKTRVIDEFELGSFCKTVRDIYADLWERTI